MLSHIFIYMVPREEGSANNTVKKQVTLFTIRENGENCLGLFQTIWNISATSADYMLFFTWYFLHTHNKLVLCALHAGCVQQLKSVVALSPLPPLAYDETCKYVS